MTFTPGQIVITGVAASTCYGIGVEPLYKRLAQGFQYRSRSGQSFDAQGNGFKQFRKISHDVTDLLRKTRTNNRLTHHVLAAVDFELGPEIRSWQADVRANVGTALGNSSGNFKPYFKFFYTARQEGYLFVNPTHFPTTLLNYSTVQLNNGFSLNGSSTTISSGFAAGIDAIGYAVMQLRLGKEKIMFAGGIEEINDFNLSFLKSDRAISPSGFIHPFKKNRDGTVPGEGVGILMLETKNNAEDAGRKSLGEIKGYDKGHGRIEDSEQVLVNKACQVIRRALDSAEIQPGDIQAIFPSANGSVPQDEFERSVLKATFGANLNQIPIYPVKSILGESFTASGPLQCIAAIYAMTEATADRQSANNVPGSGGLCLPAQINRCQNALVYSFALDRSFSALVISAHRSA